MNIETNLIIMRNKRLKNQQIINKRENKVKPLLELQKEMIKRQTIINLFNKRS